MPHPAAAAPLLSPMVIGAIGIAALAVSPGWLAAWADGQPQSSAKVR